MTQYIYKDIETIPTQNDRVRELIAAAIKPPGNYKKQDTIDKWVVEEKPAAVEEAIAKTALDGGFGHVVCIGWASAMDMPDALVIDDIKDERDLIVETFAAIETRRDRWDRLTLVGHNFIKFDHRFILQRCIVLGIPLPTWFPRDAKPWSDEIHDTMVMWAGAKDYVSMDRLCQILGLDGKSIDGMDGSQVGSRWARGAVQEIAEYCVGDIIRTRGMHLKMIDAFGLPSVKAVREVLDLNDAVSA